MQQIQCLSDKSDFDDEGSVSLKLKEKVYMYVTCVRTKCDGVCI